ncbi:MAG: cytochrome c [Bauldia sp.]
MLALGLAAPALAQSAAADRGHALAVASCARCHAVEKTGDSPNPQSPPFRLLHQRYPVANLEEALAEGIFVGHAEMPQFEFDPREIGDFIAYLESLEK